jgi:beta-galactosidase
VRRAQIVGILAAVAVLILTIDVGFAAELASPRVVKLFDDDWRFFKGDAAGAEAVAFDDSQWRALSVPHDWSIEGPFDQAAPTRGSGAFLPAGMGWYRKHFTLPADYAKRRVFIEFDGVMANSEVWINGHSLGKRPFGYVSFRYDMTNQVNFGEGQSNVIAVKADNSKQPASRWYAGAGIYRHVHLEAVNPVHLDLWPQYVTAKIADGNATVHVQCTVKNDSDSPRQVNVTTELADPSGKPISTQNASIESAGATVGAGETASFEKQITVASPQIWDLDHPNLYQAITKLTADGATTDTSTATFGIRDAVFDAEKGFLLNGQPVKIKGVCLHHDAGCLGAAVPASVWQSRLQALKDMGCNAVRTSHNPPSPEFLDCCDRLGLLVMDEMFDCWTQGKNTFDYHVYFKDWWKQDTTDTLLRDRDHPSIVIYSAGNEIRDIHPNDDLGTKVFVGIRDVMHELDPTRPVTVAVLQPNQHGVYKPGGFAEQMDVVGQNYRENELLAAHKAHPEWKIIGTENHHEVNTWVYLRDNPAYSGQFLWTGFDYLGESNAWPNTGYNWALFDRTGGMHGIGFQRESWWSERPMVHLVRRERPANSGAGATNAERLPRLFSDWSPNVEPGTTENIEAYSNCDDVELFLNDKSLGMQSRPADNASPRQWKVPFAAGTIKAVAKNNGKEVASHELRTAGKPAKIVLAVDRQKLPADWDDVAIVRATIVDENGTRVPAAADGVTFTTAGPAEIAAVDSADWTSHELFQTNHRQAFQGECIAIVRANAPSGEIKVTAKADGLTPGSVSLTVPK